MSSCIRSDWCCFFFLSISHSRSLCGMVWRGINEQNLNCSLKLMVFSLQGKPMRWHMCGWLSNHHDQRAMLYISRLIKMDHGYLINIIGNRIWWIFLEWDSLWVSRDLWMHLSPFFQYCVSRSIWHWGRCAYPERRWGSCILLIWILWHLSSDWRNCGFWNFGRQTF